MTLRARDMHFTHPSTSSIGYDSPRKLFFKLGDHPSVIWDWWNNPASSAFSLREYLECLITIPPDWLRMALETSLRSRLADPPQLHDQRLMIQPHQMRRPV